MDGENLVGPAWTGEAVGDTSGADNTVRELLHSQPPVPYMPEERQLSVVVWCETEQLLLGGRDNLVLLKLYPRQGDGSGLAVEWSNFDPRAVRREMAERIASDALNFFRPLRGGVTTQQSADGIIVQRRPFSTAYPHINLERDDFYDAPTRRRASRSWARGGRIASRTSAARRARTA